MWWSPLGTCKCTPKIWMFVLYLSLLARCWQSSSSFSWIFRYIYECANSPFPSEPRCLDDSEAQSILKLCCACSPAIFFRLIFLFQNVHTCLGHDFSRLNRGVAALMCVAWYVAVRGCGRLFTQVSPYLNKGLNEFQRWVQKICFKQP